MSKAGLHSWCKTTCQKTRIVQKLVGRMMTKEVTKAIKEHFTGTCICQVRLDVTLLVTNHTPTVGHELTVVSQHLRFNQLRPRTSLRSWRNMPLLVPLYASHTHYSLLYMWLANPKPSTRATACHAHTQPDTPFTGCAHMLTDTSAVSWTRSVRDFNKQEETCSELLQNNSLFSGKRCFLTQNLFKFVTFNLFRFFLQSKSRVKASVCGPQRERNKQYLWAIVRPSRECLPSVGLEFGERARIHPASVCSVSLCRIITLLTGFPVHTREWTSSTTVRQI